MKGQSLIELIIASAIFLVVVAGIGYLVLTTYIINREGREKTQAILIAEEGLEAARAIRDKNWGSLTVGDHGVGIVNGTWAFAGSSDTIQNKFTRVVNVSDLSQDKKKIISRVTWFFRASDQRQVELVSYLTDWQRLAPGGVLVYGDGGTTSDLMRYRILDAVTGTWGAVGTVADIHGATSNRAARRLELYASHTRNEKILISRHFNGTTQFIYGQVFNGITWGNVMLLSSWNANSFLDVRNFDGAYLGNGDFMAVYSDNTNTPKFRVWNGSSWSAQVATRSVGGTPVYIVARARPGTSEVMVGTFDNGRDTNTEYFNGGAYLQANWTLHTQHGGNAPANTKKFLNFSWSPNYTVKGALLYSDAANDTALNIKIWTADNLGGGSWSVTANTLPQASQLGPMALAGPMGRDEFIACDKDANIVPRVLCYTSDFTPLWTNPANQTIASVTDTGIQQSFDIGFEASGGLALAIYSDGTTIPKLKKYTAATTVWDAAATNLTTLGGALETVKLIPKEDSDDIMVLFGDTNQDLSSVVWNGVANAMYSAPSGRAFSTHGVNGSQDEGFWFDFAWDMF